MQRKFFRNMSEVPSCRIWTHATCFQSFWYLQNCLYATLRKIGTNFRLTQHTRNLFYILYIVDIIEINENTVICLIVSSYLSNRSGKLDGSSELHPARARRPRAGIDSPCSRRYCSRWAVCRSWNWWSAGGSFWEEKFWCNYDGKRPIIIKKI